MSAKIAFSLSFCLSFLLIDVNYYNLFMSIIVHHLYANLVNTREIYTRFRNNLAQYNILFAFENIPQELVEGIIFALALHLDLE